MLLGFKRRFAPFVEDGSKTHTIRGIRKNPPRVGEMCHCYVDPRQKTMRLLGRWPCVRVENFRVEIRQTATGPIARAWVDGNELSADECSALAWRDGFRNSGTGGAFREMAEYWLKLHPAARPYHFEGTIIHWKRPAAL